MKKLFLLIGFALPILLSGQRTIFYVKTINADTQYMYQDHNMYQEFGTGSFKISDISTTTGDYCAFIGDGAGTSSTGDYNTAIGYRALYSNITGESNTAIGFYSLYYGQNGVGNMAIGRSSQYGHAVNTTGNNYNVSIGYIALQFNETGDRNIAMNYGALRNNTTGNDNTAIGYYAGYTNQTGSYNTFIGREAGEKNTASFNTFIGMRAGEETIGGQKNLFIGYETGTTNTTGDFNVYLGHQAGQTSTGSSNVFLGYQAGYNEGGSNKLYIDNSNTSTPLIYGEFDNDVVGINDATGDSTLHVGGGAVVETDVLVNDGWHNWTATLRWTTDPVVPTIDSAKYRYMWINNTVYFHINIFGDNDTGGGIVLSWISLPVNPRDRNMYYTVTEEMIPDLSTPSPTRNGAYIDADADLRIEFYNFVTIANTKSFAIFISGFYEVLAKRTLN